MKPITFDPSLARLFGAAPVYGFGVVEKVTQKKKYPRYLVATAFCLLLSDTTGRVKRVWRYEEIESIKASGQQMLIRSSSNEPDQLLEWVADTRNDPSDAESFLQKVKFLYKRKNFQQEMQLHEAPPGTDLKGEMRWGHGAKLRPKDKVAAIKQSAAPKVTAPSPPPAAPAQPQEQHSTETPPPSKGVPVVQIPADASDSSDDEHGPAFNNGAARRENPELQYPIPLRKPRSGRGAGGSGRGAGSPSWVPGLLPPSQTPPPYSVPAPWEVHYSKKAAEGRPYWYNTVTGENTWVPPYDQGPAGTSARGASYSLPRSQNPSRLPTYLRVPEELRRQLDADPGARASPRSDAVAILEHAAACAGTDISTLVDAAADVAARRQLLRGYETVIV